MMHEYINGFDELPVGRKLDVSTWGDDISSRISHVWISLFGGEKAEGAKTVCPKEVDDARIFFYRLASEGPGIEEVAVGADEEAAVGAVSWPLPCPEFEGQWESLWFDSDVRRELMSYASTAVFFASHGVDPSLVSVNRVVLLHGPPGTGKTTLCKGLAQKLAIRMQDRFPRAALLEINAHSLFSKWFSESGKLVARLFEQIGELVEDEDALVCVLIDEVESLTAARKAALAGSEPSDAVRVVNALLTQIDALRQKDNVLILTTSNITDAVDVAFVDRADLKLYIGPPSPYARLAILRSCILELVRAGVIHSPGQGDNNDQVLSADKSLPHPSELTTIPSPVSASADPDDIDTELHPLVVAARASDGLSGRALRKLPFQAHATFLRPGPTDMRTFLHALNSAVRRELSSRRDLSIS